MAKKKLKGNSKKHILWQVNLFDSFFMAFNTPITKYTCANANL